MLLPLARNLTAFIPMRSNFPSFLCCVGLLVSLDRAFCHWQLTQDIRWGLALECAVGTSTRGAADSLVTPFCGGRPALGDLIEMQWPYSISDQIKELIHV